MTGSVYSDAAVVGSGPNGLAAAVTLARAGRSVVVYEARDTAGGALCSSALTLPGFVHDVGAAVFPMAVDTPFFRDLPLREHGLELISPEASVAHPFDDGSAAVIYRDLGRAIEELGDDGPRYRWFLEPILHRWDLLVEDLLSPMRVPVHPAALAVFGLRVGLPVTVLGRALFMTEKARGLLAGLASHSILPLWHPLSTAFAAIMAVTCHRPGWPIARGGAGRLAMALSSYLVSLGGEVITSRTVQGLGDIEPAQAVFFDVAPSHAVAIAGGRLRAGYGARVRSFRPGPGAFKVDWALDGPIPWKARECRLAATVHLGGAMAEIASAEGDVWRGRCPEKPFVLLVQPSLFDPARAPEGKHTAWAYCHVPNGSDIDMTVRIEAQVERFAPGFRDLVIGRNVMGPKTLEDFDANCIGGDIAGGANTLRQVFGRPVFGLNPYAMGTSGMFLCSASTPPGGGVHGLCGYHAARAFLEGR